MISSYASLLSVTVPVEAVDRGHDKIKVAHVLGSLDRGGVEMRTLDLVQSLDGRVATYMVTLSGREGALAAKYRAAGANIVPIAVYSWAFAFRFIFFLCRHKIDVVHSHIHHTSGFITFIAMLVGVKVRIVHYRSDGQSDDALSFFARAKARVLRLMIAFSATKIVAVSPSTLALAWNDRWADDPRCSVLLNGFDLTRYSRTSEGPKLSSFRDLPGPLLLHLGRADLPTKNRDGAITIFNRYCERENPGTLIFVGRDGMDDEQARSNRERWNRLTESGGTTERVFFLGEREDIIDVLFSVDVLLFTSLLEGLPGALVEACCAGVPVVATDLPGCQFLAGKLPRVRLLSLNDPLDAWVDVLQDELRSPLLFSERTRALEAIRGSDLDLVTVERSYMELWTK